jgi:hypothetical protein
MSNNVSFYDNFVPTLKPGEYNVHVSQALTAKAGSDVPDAPQAPVTQTFIVRGPRFQLDPADVHRVFPPAGGTGFYDEYMPMIVLNKRALPWERELDLTPRNVACPWVALLVFSETDLPAPGPPGSLNNPTRTISVPLNKVIAGQNPGPPENTLGPTLKIKADEDPARIFCNVVDVPAAIFVGLMPVVADLPLLAHVRQVPTVAKEPQDAKHDGWYSSVIANRFAVPPPKSGNASRMSNIVHLVSLEGYEKYIQSDGTVVQPTQKTVRLISLYSWSFECLRDPAENFAALMLNLIAQTNGERPDLLLRLPLDSKIAPPAEPAALAAYTRLHNGYTPMSYASQTGDQSFAWYRGPLAPVVAEEFLAPPESGENPRTPANTSEAMIFDTGNGTFDLSYAVAFQTGRSLALSSLPFSTALLQWRRESHASVDRLMEHLHSNFLPLVSNGALLKTGGGIAGLGVTDLADLLDEGLVANAFKSYLATEFHEEVANHVGRTGAFTSDDANGLLKSAKPRRPVTPADLMNLTLQPPVTSLLEHLSGLTDFGTTAIDVGPDATTLKLQSPGATEAIAAGAQLVLESPEGETIAVRVAAAVAAGDVHVAIESLNGESLNRESSNGESSNAQPAPPAGSVLRLRGADDDTTKLIAKWLARAVLLYGVPFNNLIADERMLPLESIRFFYVDNNWIDALLDGALSVGTQSSRDGLFNQLMRDAIHRAVDTTVHQVRGEMLKQSGASAPASELGTLAGFVLRSAVVSGWPGLEVRAYEGKDQKQPMMPLRLDRVGPDVMIGIYSKVPQRVEFDEPSEGLVFGTEDAGIDLRYVPGAAAVKPENVGKLVEPKVTLARKDFPWRKAPGSADTLQIGGKDGMAEKLWGKLDKPIQPPAPFGPAAFAVQMVRVPEQMLFLPKRGKQ